MRPAVTEKVLQRLGQVKPEFDSLDQPDPISRRELEVLRLMAAGLSNREIAGSLGNGRGHHQDACVEHSVEAGRERPDARRTA